MTDTLHPIDKGLADVILEAHIAGYTVKSDFARSHADYIAMAASMGLLSTRVHRDVFSREWRPTVAGLRFLGEMDLVEDAGG